MNEIKLLVVEDNNQDLLLCRRAIQRFNTQPDRQLCVVIVDNLSDAIDALDKSYDGALIDLKIDDDEDAGNQIIREIEALELCIPVIILTGTPSWAQTDLSYVEIMSKANPGSSYDDLLERFYRIYQTGITKILGGRGEMEKRLGTVYRTQIAPLLEKWEGYGVIDSERTENALLRHVLYHLVQLIDEDAETSFPEEFYLFPSANEHVRTGSVIDSPTSERRCVVLTPDCDLVLRDGERKTDRILLAEIVTPNDLFPNYCAENASGLSRNDRRNFENALKNNYTLYYHCLPKTEYFDLGFLDFRRLRSVPERRINSYFDNSRKIQIAPPFVKDIVARFSTYYARQGQPVIDL